jgi:hypothetical protein
MAATAGQQEGSRRRPTSQTDVDGACYCMTLLDMAVLVRADSPWDGGPSSSVVWKIVETAVDGGDLIRRAAVSAGRLTILWLFLRQNELRLGPPFPVIHPNPRPSPDDRRIRAPGRAGARLVIHQHDALQPTGSR